jgi:hypothetical protein
MGVSEQISLRLIQAELLFAAANDWRGADWVR